MTIICFLQYLKRICTYLDVHTWFWHMPIGHKEASVVQWLCHSPCKTGVAGSIHMTLAVGGTLNPNQPTNQFGIGRTPARSHTNY